MKIENMDPEELKDKLKNDKKFIDLKESHQINYIVDFFSEPLMKDGKYIDDAHLADLLQLYYIELPIKIEWWSMASRIERWLNVVILNLCENNEISIKTTDNDNNFNKVIKKYESASKDEKDKIFNKLISVHWFSNIKDCEQLIIYLNAARHIRNFCVHHYTLASYKYSKIIDNGNRHKEKDGKERVLKDDAAKLISFFTYEKALQSRKKVFGYMNQFKWSSPKIKKVVSKIYEDIFEMKIIEKLSRENTSSLTQFLNFKK